ISANAVPHWSHPKVPGSPSSATALPRSSCRSAYRSTDRLGRERASWCRSRASPGLSLRLIHLHIFLHRVDEIFPEVFIGNFLLGDLAERYYGILVVIALYGNLGAGGNGAGTVACQKHELEAVGNLVDAILDGDASHQGVLVRFAVIWPLFRQFA